MNHINFEARCERLGKQTTHYIKMDKGSCYLTRGIGETDESVRKKALLFASAPALLSVLKLCEQALLAARLAVGKVDETNERLLSPQHRRVYESSNQAVVRATQEALDQIRETLAGTNAGT